MARKRKRKNPRRKRRNPESHAAYVRGGRKAARHRRRNPGRRRRRNPGYSRRRNGGNMGHMAALGLAGLGAAAVIWGGLAFQTTFMGNTQSLVGAGIGLGGGLLLGAMGKPDYGLAVAVGGAAPALAQFVTAEVAVYENQQATNAANASSSSAATPPSGGLNVAGLNVGPMGDSLQGAMARLSRLGMR